MQSVFWSWQSELANSTNRGLIEDALKAAVKAIHNDTTIAAAPRVDKDVVGVPGAPDIADTILEKIDDASVFVCDVSLINRGNGVRTTPNPNVLFELGYAVAKLGWRRIILVLNEAYGAVEELPFDLQKKLALIYRSSPEDRERAPARKKLRTILEIALRTILTQEAQVGVGVTSSRSFDLLNGIPAGARRRLIVHWTSVEANVYGGNYEVPKQTEMLLEEFSLESNRAKFSRPVVASNGLEHRSV